MPTKGNMLMTITITYSVFEYISDWILSILGVLARNEKLVTVGSYTSILDGSCESLKGHLARV